MPEAGTTRRILVVAPSWLGDTVMAQSLFKALVQAAGTEIDVLAPAWLHPLLARMPEVHTAVDAPFRSGKLQIKTRFLLGRALSYRRYDQAIVLPNSWKSALVPYWAGIPVRTGYIGEQRWGLLNDARKLDESALPMTVQRFVALARPRNSAHVDTDLLPPALAAAPVSQGRHGTQDLEIEVSHGPILALCPGAEFGPAKRWPSAHFAAVAEAKLERDWQVCLLGSAGDASVAAAINRVCKGRCVDLTGKTDIGQVVGLISLATAVVSNDSGLMHLAAALGRPLVAIYGSTDPGHTPPLGTSHRIVYLGLECSPCFERECPLQHLNCLRQITPDQVIDALDQLLARSPPAPAADGADRQGHAP